MVNLFKRIVKEWLNYILHKYRSSPTTVAGPNNNNTSGMNKFCIFKAWAVIISFTICQNLSPLL